MRVTRCWSMLAVAMLCAGAAPGPGASRPGARSGGDGGVPAACRAVGHPRHRRRRDPLKAGDRVGRSNHARRAHPDGGRAPAGGHRRRPGRARLPGRVFLQHRGVPPGRAAGHRQRPDVGLPLRRRPAGRRHVVGRTMSSCPRESGSSSGRSDRPAAHLQAVLHHVRVRRAHTEPRPQSGGTRCGPATGRCGSSTIRARFVPTWS